MATHPPRSLRHEYGLWVENEIELYKDSVPRSVLLKLGDEAVASLEAQSQLFFTEILIWEEVDRIIAKRLRIPAFTTWRRRRLKQIAELRKPEHWGLAADAPMVRAISHASERHVLVARPGDEGSALYLAANGCEVTAVADGEDEIERVLSAAHAAGLESRLRLRPDGLAGWAPDDRPLAAVVCTAAAFAGLCPEERARAIDLLQGATEDGGVHLVETIVAGQGLLTLDELRTRYRGWQISVERHGGGAGRSFLARKGVA